jgi:conjugative transfer pilus assembly protein TraH
MSFLNANYLVKQLQSILQNAPSVALDLALNVLCTQCAKSIKEFQSMMSRLNNLQLDSCKATQAIVAKTMSEASDYEEPELDGIVADYEQSSVYPLSIRNRTTNGCK